jgi:hypothetical protein
VRCPGIKRFKKNRKEVPVESQELNPQNASSGKNKLYKPEEILEKLEELLKEVNPLQEELSGLQDQLVEEQNEQQRSFLDAKIQIK